MTAERARIARDIQYEIGRGLAQIRLMSDVNGGRLPTKAETQRMSRLARQSSDRLREVIWSLASEASSVDDLGDYFHTLVGEFFDESGVETRVIVEGGPPNREISPSTRRELVFATKGIMSNVIRHAEASLFFVEVRGTKTTLVVSFRDNGIGFDPENIPPGSLGVAMLRERIEQLGGKFELVTHVGGGTRIRISVPYAPVGKR